MRRCGLGAFIVGRGVAGERQRIRGPGQRPDMFSLAHQNASGRFRRPSHALGVAQNPTHLAGEIMLGFVRRSDLRGCAEAAGLKTSRQRRAAQLFHAILQAFADHAPIAQVFGDAPDQANGAVAQRRNFLRRRRKEIIGGRAHLFGEDRQKLTAAARSQQNLGQAQLCQQRAGQNFA